MIFLNIGSNDIRRPEYREDDLVAVYRRILLSIQERLPRTKIRVLSFYPVHSGLLPEEVRAMMFAKRTNVSIDAVNLRLEGLASELGCTYIDVNTCLRDREGNLDPKYTVEGIHLYPNAYEVVLDTLVKYF
jgi:lysophospholipase L1-like esterase